MRIRAHAHVCLCVFCVCAHEGGWWGGGVRGFTCVYICVCVCVCARARACMYAFICDMNGCVFAR